MRKKTSPTSKIELIILVDRRSDIRDALLKESALLTESVRGLICKELHDDVFDKGKYRDFVPTIRLEHESREALFIVVDELVDIFGWKIDLQEN